MEDVLHSVVCTSSASTSTAFGIYITSSAEEIDQYYLNTLVVAAAKVACFPVQPQLLSNP